MSLVELMIALVIVALGMLVMVQQLTLSYHENATNQQRAFAYGRATTMLAEIQAGVERGTIATADALDRLDDAGHGNPVLTTLVRKGSLLDPEHPSSGNLRRADGSYEWHRVVDVVAMPFQDHMRFVRVRVVHVDQSGHEETMATIAGVLACGQKTQPPVQVHDVYLLAIAEAPSMWKPVAKMREAMEAVRSAVRSSAPNLDLRLHWITKFGYGRDAEYVPYLNTRELARDAAPFAYWYPGRIEDTGELTTLYAASLFSGRIRTEAGIQNDYDPVTCRVPHAVADQWNHCLRLPEAKALFQARVAAGLEDEHAPPLQILLEDMASDPAKYRNAMVLNLHGTALPFPPLRNVSDPAKDDVARPGVRVVTHPGKLRPARDPDGNGDPSDGEDCEFRVHAWRAEDVDAGGSATVATITLEIPGIDLSANVNGVAPTLPTTLEVRRLVGGVDTTTGLVSNAATYEGFDTPQGLPPSATAPHANAEMWFEAEFSGGSTWLRLHNTPCRAPQIGTRGLPTRHRLYGCEYLPSPVRSAVAFEQDLATDGDVPKNTARWRIRIPRRVFAPGFPGGGWPVADRQVTVRTRLSDLGTTSAAPATTNLSTTWAWWARSPEAVPWTERYQILGDPRHNPYLDLCHGGSSFPDGYDWYFDDLVAGGVDARPEYPCLDAARLRDGFGDGVLADAPRALAVFRGAAMKCNALLTNAGGLLAEQLVFGNEILLPNDLTANERRVVLAGAWFGASGASAVTSLPESLDPAAAVPATPSGAGSVGMARRSGAHAILGGGSAASFFVKEWLGELRPVRSAATWATRGNLGAGRGTDQLYHVVRADEPPPGLPRGTDWTRVASPSLGSIGGTTFLQVGSPTASETWVQVRNQGPTLQAARGLAAGEIMAAVGIKLPEFFSCAWPFLLADAAVLPVRPPHLEGASADSYPGLTLRMLESAPLYGGAPSTATGDPWSGKFGSGIVQIQGSRGEGSMCLSILGLTPRTQEELDTLGPAALLFALRGYHAGSLGADGTRIEEVPRTEIVEPRPMATLASAAGVTVRWHTPFLRFDGQAYTKEYAAQNAPPPPPCYNGYGSVPQGATVRTPIQVCTTGGILQLQNPCGARTAVPELPMLEFVADTLGVYTLFCTHACQDFPLVSWTVVAANPGSAGGLGAMTPPPPTPPEQAWESNLVHRLLLSRDDGLSWTDAKTGKPATVGTFPGLDSEIAESGAGDETYPIAAPLPVGDVRIRIETYSRVRPSNLAWHEVRVRVTP